MLLLAIIAAFTLAGSLTVPTAVGAVPSRAQSSELSVTAGAAVCPSDVNDSGVNTDLSTCVPAAGVTINGVTGSGDSLGSCVTAGSTSTSNDGSYASCQIPVPNGLSDNTELFFTQDPSTVPAGYEAPGDMNGTTVGITRDYGSPILFYNIASDAGSASAPPEPTVATGTRATTETGSATQAATQPASSTGTTGQPNQTATAEAAGSKAAIYAGTCETKDLGKPVAELTDVRTPTGDRVGSSAVTDVEISFTTIDPSLNDLLGDDHVLVVFDQNDASVPLACGAVGGIQGKDGSLVIGLPAVGDSVYSGVGYLSPSSNGTAVSIFLVKGLSANQQAG